MTKRIISFMLVIAMLISACVIGTAASGNPTIYVGSATAAAGETVSVPVKMIGNPGINAFVLGFKYDETRLTLDSVDVNPLLGGDFEYTEKAVWLSETDSTFEGTILTLNFTVLSNAELGDAAVEVTYSSGDICNLNEEDVEFKVLPGAVTVPNPSLIVSSVSALKGTEAKVDVMLANNTGINAFVLGFDYDTTRLSLKKVEVNKDLGGSFEYTTKAVWLGENDTMFNGKILTLTFDVLATAPLGYANVAVTYAEGDICDYNENDVAVDLVAGKVLVSSATSPKMTVATVAGSAGAKVDVAVNVANNPGFAAAILDVDFDKTALTLTGATVAGAAGGDVEVNGNKVAWVAAENYTQNGTFVTLHFTVSSSAKGTEYAVAVSYAEGNICNADEEDVLFATEAGKITLGEAPYFKLGDLNLDGKVSIIDLNLMKSVIVGLDTITDVQKKCGDFNEDGKITVLDVASLKSLMLGVA